MRGDAYGAHGERRLDALLATLRRRRVDPFITPGSVLVDLGCGHAGSLLKAYSDTIERGIGFDVSVGPTPAANVELHAQAVDAPLPLADSSVDVVSCLAVIEHVDRPDVLWQLRRNGSSVPAAFSSSPRRQRRRSPCSS